MCMGILPALYVCGPPVYCVLGGQKAALELLKRKLHMSLRAAVWVLVLCKSRLSKHASVPLSREVFTALPSVSPAPPYVLHCG